MVIYYFFKSDWNHLVIDLFVVFLFLFFLELFVLLDQEYFILFLFPFFFLNLCFRSAIEKKKQTNVIYQEFDATYALRMRTASTISLPRLRTLLPPQRRPSAPHCTNSRHPGRIGRPASSRRWHHQTG